MKDELAHAALSWDIADWIASRLTAAERALVEEELERAIACLEEDASLVVPEAWRVTLGLPSRSQATAIMRTMRAEVWPSSIHDDH